MKPILSVIIPTLNEEKYLPELLSDLKKQTRKDFEVIIVDGKSQDLTKEKALLFHDVLKLRFITAQKTNVAFQRNYGAEKAVGEYLFFIDADTRIKSSTMNHALKHIEDEHDLLYIPLVESSNPNNLYKILTSFSVISVKFLHKIGRPLSLGPNIIIYKKLFTELKGFDSKITISEDHNLIIKAYKKGVRSHFLSDVRCDFSMRRLERDGIWAILWKYTYFTIETLVKGGVYRKSVNYEMGGQNYNQASFTK